MPDQEHKRFLDAVKCFGSHNHKAISAYVETRSAAQVRYTPRETTPFKPHPTPYNLDHTPYTQHSTPCGRYTPREIGLRVQRDQRGTVRRAALLPALPPSSRLFWWIRVRRFGRVGYFPRECRRGLTMDPACRAEASV